MKRCHRFHAEDVEVGDVLELVYADISTTITVRGKGSSRNFGTYVVSERGNTYYFDDYDYVYLLSDIRKKQ